MPFFITSIITRIKIAVTPSFVITLLLFPLIVFVANLLGGQDAGKIKIGLMYEDTPITVRVVERFQFYVDEDAEFVVFSDKEDLENAVTRQAIECGYDIDKELNITLYKGPLTVSHEVFNVMLSSALIETMSGELGAGVLKGYFPDEPKLAEEIQARADAYAAQGPAMEIKTVFMDGAGDFSEKRVIDSRLHGLTALFAFLLSLLCAVNQDELLLARLRVVGRGQVFLYLLAQAFVTFLLLFSFFILSLRAVGINMLITVAFCLALACFSLFLSVYVKKEITAFIPFLFVVTACLGQTLVNVEEIAAFLKPFTYFAFTSYYMEGITKTLPWSEAGFLSLGAVLFGGLSFIRR